MRMSGRIWSTFLAVFFISWCGGDHAALNPSVSGESTPQKATPGTITLDLTPMMDPVSTLVTIKPDNQTKVVRYSRSLLVVKSLAQGQLSQQELSKLLDKARTLAAATTICTKSFGSPGLTRGDQFYLTLNLEQREQECFGFVEDTPPAIRTLVEDLLSTSQKLNSAPLAEAYLRSEPVSQQRYEALRKLTKVKFVNLEEFPNDLQQILSTAINHSRDFFVLSMEQRKNLLSRIINSQELFISNQSSHYQLTIFLAQK